MKDTGKVCLCLVIFSIFLLLMGNEWGYIIGIPAFFGLPALFIKED